jgi:hypothetical protein
MFVWNMLNVWKYSHLCENLSYIGYWCEICSMCENMAVSEVCAISEVLCSVHNGHYIESSNWSISDEEKEKGDAPTKLASCISGMRISLLLNMHKKISIDYSPPNAPCANTQHARWHTYMHVCVPMGTCGPGARSTAWSTSRLTFLKQFDFREFKS